MYIFRDSDRVSRWYSPAKRGTALLPGASEGPSVPKVPAAPSNRILSIHESTLGVVFWLTKKITKTPQRSRPAVVLLRSRDLQPRVSNSASATRGTSITRPNALRKSTASSFLLASSTNTVGALTGAHQKNNYHYLCSQHSS